MKIQTKNLLPIKVDKILKKLGKDIKDARRRRNIPVDLMSEKAMTSRATLHRLEKGAPEVNIGLYATVLYILGLEHNLEKIADIKNDELGLALDEERLPKRIHLKNKKDDDL